VLSSFTFPVVLSPFSSLLFFFFFFYLLWFPCLYRCPSYYPFSPNQVCWIHALLPVVDLILLFNPGPLRSSRPFPILPSKPPLPLFTPSLLSRVAIFSSPKSPVKFQWPSIILSTSIYHSPHLFVVLANSPLSPLNSDGCRW